MRINVKELTNLLYVCNVNFYEFTIDTEHMDIDIELTDYINGLEKIDVDELYDGLCEIFGEDNFEFEDDRIWISLLNFEDIGMI